MNSFLFVAVLTVAYCAVTVALTAVIGRLRAGQPAIVAGCAVFGLLSGLLAAWAWPLDSAVYANVYAVLLGDQVYAAAIRWLGDPHSAQAHTTIPWVLRVPQVYVPVALVISVAAGWLAQWLHGRIATMHQESLE